MTWTNYTHGITSFGIPVVPDISAGIGVGDVYWLVAAKTDSDAFYCKLREKVDDATIFSTLAAAYAACTTGQSDTIFVAPGRYDVTATLDWTKNNIQVVGLCGPNNQESCAATIASRSAPGCTFYTATSGVDHVLHVTGYRNQFYNLSFVNGGAAATNLSAVKLGGVTTYTAYGNYFSRCTFHGCMSTSQNTTENASVTIGSGAGMYLFEDCIIGQNTFGGDRATEGQAHVYYCGTTDSGASAGVGSQNGIWRRCTFLNRTATAAAGVGAMIRVGDHATAYTASSSDEAMDRIHLFTDCTFSNWGGQDCNLPTVILDLCGSYHQIHLHNCSAYGYDEWAEIYGANPAGRVFVTMAVSNATNAGIGIVPTA